MSTRSVCERLKAPSRSTRAAADAGAAIVLRLATARRRQPSATDRRRVRQWPRGARAGRGDRGAARRGRQSAAVTSSRRRVHRCEQDRGQRRGEHRARPCGVRSSTSSTPWANLASAGKPEPGGVALDGVGGAEDRLQRLVVVRARFELDEGHLHLAEVLFGLGAEDVPAARSRSMSMGSIRGSAEAPHPRRAVVGLEDQLAAALAVDVLGDRPESPRRAGSAGPPRRSSGRGCAVPCLPERAQHARAAEQLGLQRAALRARRHDVANQAGHGDVAEACRARIAALRQKKMVDPTDAGPRDRRAPTATQDPRMVVTRHGSRDTTMWPACR